MHTSRWTIILSSGKLVLQAGISKYKARVRKVSRNSAQLFIYLSTSNARILLLSHPCDVSSVHRNSSVIVLRLSIIIIHPLLTVMRRRISWERRKFHDNSRNSLSGDHLFIIFMSTSLITFSGRTFIPSHPSIRRNANKSAGSDLSLLSFFLPPLTSRTNQVFPSSDFILAPLFLPGGRILWLISSTGIRVGQ